MRVHHALCVAAIGAFAAAGSAQAQAASPPVSSDVRITMSTEELKALLASPALNIANLLPQRGDKAAKRAMPSCPVVDNDGIDSAATTQTEGASQTPVVVLGTVMSPVLHRSE